MKRMFVLLMLGCCSMGCGPYLSQSSSPPPNRVAELKNDPREVTINEGVGIGVRCSDNGPCNDMHATTDDPRVAKVYPSYMGQKDDYWWTPNDAPSNLVVVGVAAGTTNLRIQAGKSLSVYTVKVLPAPVLAAAGKTK